MNNSLRRASFLLALVCFARVSLAQAPVDLADEPYHSLLIQNDYLRAFRVEIPHLKSTLLHKHSHDYVVITLVDSNIKQARAGEAPITYPRYAGDIRYIHGGIAHTMINDEAMTYRNITVEIAKPDNSLYDSFRTQDSFRDVLSPGVDPHAKYAVTLDKTGVKIWNVQLLPGDSQVRSQHAGPGELIVALDDLDLKQDGPNGSETLRLGQGEVKWLAGGAPYAFTNTGKDPAQFVIFEMK